MKKHNFYAGPSILSSYTIEKTAAAVLDFAGTGLSVLEVSHRSKEFVKVIEEARHLIKELMEVPSGYEVLFLGGGASMQFCQIPYNLLEKKAAFTETGTWSKNAIKEARAFGEAVVVGSSADKNFSYIPTIGAIPNDCEYFYYTSNNTIYGTQVHEDPNVDVPMICDMSSDFMSRRVDVSKYDLIFAGAQKNMGPAGVTIVIVRTAALGRVTRHIPTILDYRVQIEKDTMFNTPPVLPIYSTLQTLKWYKKLGGMRVLEERNAAKAALLYNEIDRNPYFVGTAATKDRSLMNVCFVMSEGNDALESDFYALAQSKGIVGIKGHRSVGGFRASIYNAMPTESVQVLVDAMKEFEELQKK